MVWSVTDCFALQDSEADAEFARLVFPDNRKPGVLALQEAGRVVMRHPGLDGSGSLQMFPATLIT
ncbi:hypothetical protein M9458_018133, partial [Cirrhinus mrigala]